VPIFPFLLKQILRSLLLALGVACLVGPAVAMDFTIGPGAGGRRIVLARGPIVTGDAERLRIALQGADRDASGLRTLALDSMGGSVVESFFMADVLDSDKVATIVRAGASCASACAQIVFLAGTYRTVEEGGRLGLHACSRGGDNTPVPLCHEAIAQHAVLRGAPYGTISAFMYLTPPGQVRWLDAEDSDCWGLTLWPPGSNRGIKPGEAPPCILHGAPPKKPAR
jgi:hypothetical protein